MENKTNFFASVESFFLRYKTLITFVLIAFIIFFLNLWMLGRHEFVYDSVGYWEFRKSFIKNGGFQITNFNSSVRGYLLPLILLAISKVGHIVFGDQGELLLIVCESLVYSSFLTLLIPKLFQLIFHRGVGYLSVLLFSLLMIYFWRGYFYYPLTDIPAFIFSCLAVYFILRHFEVWWGGFMAGIFLSGAGSIRPSYQIIIIPMVFWIIYFYVYQRKLSLRQIIVQLSILFIGIVFVYIPQAMVNISNFGIMSPFVQTQRDSGTDLFTQQLIWGIGMQKYETNIGKNYPSASVVFFDKQGEGILFNLGLKSLMFDATRKVSPGNPVTLREYLNIALKYPIEFVCIYLRHLFNGLDVRYDTPYVTNIFSSAYLRQLVNYSIWFLVLSFMIMKLGSAKKSLPKITLLIILCLPALLSIPSAVEVRFMFPLHVLCYVVVAFFVLPALLQLKTQRIKQVVLRFSPYYLIFIVVCFLLSANTYSGLEFLTPK